MRLHSLLAEAHARCVDSNNLLAKVVATTMTRLAVGALAARSFTGRSGLDLRKTSSPAFHPSGNLLGRLAFPQEERL